MRIIKNAAFAIGAVALLLGGLLLLVPSPVGATQVHFVAGDVGQLTITTDNAGAATDVYSFDLTASVNIPAGELAALDYARVDMGLDTATFTAGMLSPLFCVAESTNLGTPRATILGITGATPVFGHREAKTYGIVDNGYGSYSFSGYTPVDFGYGYGYGGAAADVTVTVGIRVTGCVGPTGGSAPFLFTAGDPDQAFKLQVFVGASATQTFPSFPVTQTLFDPNFVAPVTSAETSTAALAAAVQPPAVSESGEIAGASYMLQDASNGAGDVANEPFVGTPSAPLVFPPIDFPAGLGGSSTDSFQLSAVSTLPSGSQVVFKFDDQPATNDATTPPFGISAGILGGQLTGVPPAFYFQIQLSIPGEGFVPATGRIQVDVEQSVPNSYFTTNGVSPSLFTLRAFRDDGTLKASQPVRLAYSGLDPVTNEHGYTFRITDFSSFVAFAPVSGGGIGGGGGGGNVVTPPVQTSQAPPTPIVTSQPPVTSEPVASPEPTMAPVGVTPAPAELGGDSDGDGVPDKVESLVGTDPARNDSTPRFDMTESLVVVRGAGGNVLSWTPNAQAKGYQLWSSDSPWVLVATIESPSVTTYTDASGLATTKYKVTYFVGDSTPEGKLNVVAGSEAAVSYIPGWSEGTTQAAAPEATTEAPVTAKTPFDGTQVFIVVALIIAAVVLLLMIARRKKGNT